jgi:hypothetical protein
MDMGEEPRAYAELKALRTPAVRMLCENATLRRTSVTVPKLRVLEPTEAAAPPRVAEREPTAPAATPKG